MRKQMKIAAVVSAAALLALGASITSFAAQKGTWKYEDGEWYCYDKNGDVYENTFCLSNGKEFYVGDDGMMVRSSWVEYDGDYYFVNSAGQKIVNDWRLTTPYDDEEAEEQWFYFQSTGKRAENKKLVIKGKTYFFDSDGNMLTGWVQNDDSDYVEGDTEIGTYSGDTYYCDETGARLESTWVKTYGPEIEDEEADSDDEYWYYLKSNGKVATGKQTNIKGQTYFFGVDGKMLTGWVAKTNSNYEEIWENDVDGDGTFDTPLSAYVNDDVYFCGEDADDGHMKRNKWVKLWNNKVFGEQDDDNSKKWFYINNSGEVFIPSISDADAIVIDKLTFEDGDAEVNEIFSVDDDDANINAMEKKINGKTYLFDENGQMVSGLVRNHEDNFVYYYGGSDDGESKDGSVSITDECGSSYRFYFATETDSSDGYFDAAGINGAKNGKLYRDGLLVKAKDDKYEEKTVSITYYVAGENGEEGSYVTTPHTFIVNQSGSIQTSSKQYEDGGETVVDARGWEFMKNGGARKGSVIE